jgi:hypothetical protein
MYTSLPLRHSTNHLTTITCTALPSTASLTNFRFRDLKFALPQVPASVQRCDINCKPQPWKSATSGCRAVPQTTTLLCGWRENYGVLRVPCEEAIMLENRVGGSTFIRQWFCLSFTLRRFRAANRPAKDVFWEQPRQLWCQRGAAKRCPKTIPSWMTQALLSLPLMLHGEALCCTTVDLGLFILATITAPALIMLGLASLI